MQTLAAGEEDSIRQVIWEAMLTADLNVRYWAHLSRRYSMWDKCIKILLALASSATVASWSFWNEVDILWKGFFCCFSSHCNCVSIFEFGEKNWRNIQFKRKMVANKQGI